MKLNVADFQRQVAVAELKRRLQTRSALALTLESDRMVVALVRHSEGASEVISPPLTVPVGADAVVRDPEKAGVTLAEALDAAGLRERRCVVCVPPGWALTASTDLPEVSPEDLRGYLELRAEREFPVPLADLRLAHSAYHLPDGTLRATLAAVPAKRLDAVTAMLGAAGGRRAVSVSLALDHCLAQPQAMMHFLANGDHTDVVVTAGGGVVALRSLSNPSGATGDAAAAFDPAGFSREIRITLGRLPAAVQEQVREARFGGAEEAAKGLLLQTRDQLQRVGIETPESVNGVAAPAGAAVEAAERVLGKHVVPFEFVVPEPRRLEVVFRRFDTRRRRWMVGAALALILLPALLFFVRSRMESSYAAEWEDMRDKVAELDVLQQKIRRFRPWFEPAPQILQALDSLFAAFPEQGDVWAKSLQISAGNKVTCTGFARNQVAWLGLLDRLRARPDITALKVQQLRGENPIQFSVTYQWEPRREK